MLVRRIVGDSMRPGLRPGNIIIARRKQHIRIGDVVVARMGGREVIKRVCELGPKGFVLLGDNHPASTDSRTLGPVAQSDILGVRVMKLRFAEATAPPPPLRKDLLWVPYGLAALTTFMLLAQLLTFDKFVVILEAYFLPGGDVMARVVAALLVMGELFALPFWLRMNLSPLASAASLVSGVVFMTLWLLITLWALVISLTVDTSGRFGALVTMPFGWWVPLENLFFVGAIVLAAYVLNAPKVLRGRR